MNKEEIEELMDYNLEYLEARNSEDIFGGDYTSSVDLKYANKEIEQLQQENKQLKEKYEYALKILSNAEPPCELDGFMDKHTNYCEINCGVDEEIFKKCWDLYIEDKLRGGNNEN